MRWWFSLVSLLGLSLVCNLSPSGAQTYCPHGGQGWQPVSYQTLTITTTVPGQIDLSALPPSSTNLAMALVSVEEATLRFRFLAGVEPTDGHELPPGQHFFICGREMIAGWRAIRTSVGSADAIVHVSLFAPL